MKLRRRGAAAPTGRIPAAGEKFKYTKGDTDTQWSTGDLRAAPRPVKIDCFNPRLSARGYNGP
jgi:hypothetical protein